MNSQLEISTLDRGVTSVRLAGEVDVSNTPQLQQSLEALVREGQTRLLVDLTDVSFIDSSGLGVLLHVHRQLAEGRGRLVVLCPDQTMRELFELVGHNMLFPVEANLEQALRRLSRSRRFVPKRRGDGSVNARRGSPPPPTA